MAITVACTHRDGTGTTITGRAPLPVVIDAGSSGNTTTTHMYTATDGGVGIRFDETKWTGVTYTSGGGATRTLSKTNLASLFSWEKISLGNLPLVTSGTWTTSDVTLGDAGALWHNGTGLKGKPIAVKLAGAVVPEGTVGSLTDEQWGWGTINGENAGTNTLYVQSILTTPSVEVIYGDGTHLRLSSTAGSVAIGWFEVEDKTDKDTFKLVTDIAPGLTPTDVVVYQNVNPGLDLEYIWSATSGTVEDITNGDTRPCAATSVIDATKGYGPLWSFVFKLGFGTSTVDLVVNDLANDETASYAITVNETAWTSSTDYYIDFTLGDDTTGDGSIGTPWKTWTKLMNSLRTVSGHRRGFLKRGEVFTETVTHTQWNNETDDTLITTYGTGANPEVVCGTSITLINISENTGTASANLRVWQTDFEKTAGAQVMLLFNGAKNLLLDCNLTYGGSIGANGGVSRGSAGTSTDDSVIWNCRYETTNASANYWLYESGASGSGLRTAVVGTRFFGVGGSGTSSIIRSFFAQKLLVYNQFERSHSTANPCVRMYGGPATNKLSYVAYNNFVCGGGTVNAVSIADDGTGNNGDILLDGNYSDTTAATGITAEYQIEDASGPSILIKNAVAVGQEKFVNLNQGLKSLRLFHNSFYTGNSGNNFFMESTTSFAVYNLKIVNNAARANSSTGSSFIVRNASTNVAAIARTHMVENIFDWGTVSSAWSIAGTAGGLTSAGWPTQTNKAGQLNYTTTQGKDNDPAFTDGPNGDLSVGASSICVGAAYFLPTVSRDCRGYTRGASTRDVGAWEYAGAPPILDILVSQITETDFAQAMAVLLGSGEILVDVATATETDLAQMLGVLQSGGSYSSSFIVWGSGNWLWDPGRPFGRTIPY